MLSTTLLSYLLAITLLTITLGLDSTLILRAATLEGNAAALQVAMGIHVGCLLWGLLWGLVRFWQAPYCYLLCSSGQVLLI